MKGLGPEIYVGPPSILKLTGPLPAAEVVIEPSPVLMQVAFEDVDVSVAAFICVVAAGRGSGHRFLCLFLSLRGRLVRPAVFICAVLRSFAPSEPCEKSIPAALHSFTLLQPFTPSALRSFAPRIV